VYSCYFWDINKQFWWFSETVNGSFIYGYNYPKIFKLDYNGVYDVVWTKVYIIKDW